MFISQMSIIYIHVIVYSNDLLRLSFCLTTKAFNILVLKSMLFSEVCVIESTCATSEDVLFESTITLSFTSKLKLFYISFFTPYY